MAEQAALVDELESDSPQPVEFEIEEPRVRTAVLDGNDRLVGYEDMPLSQAKANECVIVPDRCDLPPNGTFKYVYEQKAFFPPGKGFPPLAKAPVELDVVVYKLAKMVAKLGGEPDPDVSEWTRWFEEVLRRNEEASRRNRNNVVKAR